ncbi:MAG: hypothetical protein NTX66_01975 [Candidatus Falkowbacteria bacterium]|nr:hypothetical protein [Candidatus Falkowbacteria bacterium]
MNCSLNHVLKSERKNTMIFTILCLLMGIMFLIGIFSPRTKKLATEIKSFILNKITQLFKLLSPSSRRIIVSLIIGSLLMIWYLKQRFLG